jgi:hypothetical protein
MLVHSGMAVTVVGSLVYFAFFSITGTPRVPGKVERLE